MRDKIFLVLIACWLCGTDHLASGQDDTAQTDGDTARLHAVIQSYVDAFNAREVEKLVSHWSPDGVYTSRMTGEAVLGREAVAQEFQEMFQGEQTPKLAVATESIEFISPNVALERGTALVTRAEDDVV